MQQVLRSDPLSAAGVAKPVIFFDDVCVMCNGFVNLLDWHNIQENPMTAEERETYGGIGIHGAYLVK